MADKIKEEQKDSEKKLPAVDGAEQVQETDLDDVAGGWNITLCTITKEQL